MARPEDTSDHVQQAIAQLAAKNAQQEEAERQFQARMLERQEWDKPENVRARQSSTLKSLREAGIHGLFGKTGLELSGLYPGVIFRESHPSENSENKVKLQLLWKVHRDPKDRRILEADNSVTCLAEEAFGQPTKIKFYRGGQVTPINLSSKLHENDDNRDLGADDLLEFADKAMAKALTWVASPAQEIVEFTPRRGPLGAIDRRDARYRDPLNQAIQTFSTTRYPPPKS